MTVRAYDWKVDNAATPKVVRCHMYISRWQQMVQNVTRLGDSVKQFVSSDLQ